MAKPLSDEKRLQIENLLRVNEGKAGIDQLVAKETGVAAITVGRIRRSLSIEAGSRGRPAKHVEEPKLERPMDELSRLERVTLLRSKMESQAKYKQLTGMLDANERQMFFEEFSSITTDLEALDPVEEQHLYMMILTFIFATRHSVQYQAQKVAFEADPAKNPAPDSSLMAEFMKAIDQYNKYKANFVKHQADKRDRVVKQGKSFLDFNEIYSDRQKQLKAGKDIVELAKKTDDELRRMI